MQGLSNGAFYLIGDIYGIIKLNGGAFGNNAWYSL